MSELWYPGLPHDPGASSWQNSARLQPIRAVTLHRTIGTYPGDYSVGKHREHSSPGTFNFLIGQSFLEGVEFYPLNVQCTHAAGSNHAGPGIEFSGQNGEPLTEWQIAMGGKLIRWIAFITGVDLLLYDGEAGRVYVDTKSDFNMFVNHRGVAYPPNPTYQHYDYIDRAQFTRMATQPKPADPPAPTPAPAPTPVDWNAIRRWLIGVTKTAVAAGPDLSARRTLIGWKPGSTGDEVKAWQDGLNLTLNKQYHEAGAYGIRVFGAETREATINWQKFYGRGTLTADGVVGPATRAAMVKVLGALK